MLAYRKRMASSGRRITEFLLTGEHRSRLTSSQYIQRKTLKAWSISTSQPASRPICAVPIQ